MIGQTFLVPTSSMEGTLLVGDYIFASPLTYGVRLPGTAIRAGALREPSNGDVVVFRPDFYEPRIDVLKRIVGEPGDTLQMVGRVLYRNGDRVVEPYVGTFRSLDVALTLEGPLGQGWQLDALPKGIDRAKYRATRDTWGPLVIPDGQYFLLGDNRDRSTDSRQLGFVPRDVIRAKVLRIVHSVDPTSQNGFPGVFRRARWERSGMRVP